MERTCSNCNHWETEAPAVQAENYGECNELSNGKAEMKYILPVIDAAQKPSAGILTGADFGCNLFAPAGEA